MPFLREHRIPDEISALRPLAHSRAELFGHAGILALDPIAGIDQHQAAADVRRHQSHQGLETFAFMHADPFIAPTPDLERAKRLRMKLVEHKSILLSKKRPR